MANNSALAGIDILTMQYGEPMFYNSDFLNFIEPHLNWIKSRSDTITLTPTLLDTTVYKGDLHGYIISVSITYAPYLAVATRLTGLTNSNQFDNSITSVYIPSIIIMNQLLTQYNISPVIKI